MAQSVAQNLDILRRRIAEACQRSGRNSQEITLVGVTKSVGSDLIREAVQAGLHDVGENYVRELLGKREELGAEDIRWHFIGHLQSNKVRHLVGWVHLVHSVDSLNLASELSRRAVSAGRTVNVLLEVNSTGEGTKFGIRPVDLTSLVERALRLPNLSVEGLMTIGPFLPDPEGSRPSFRLMRSLRENLASEGFPMPHLSMGMTNDVEIAVEEGATLVRVGTAIFGPRQRRGRA